MSDSTRGMPAWLAPQVIVAGLLLIAALVFAWRGPMAPGLPPAIELDLKTGGASARPTEIELALLEPSGLERLVFKSVPVPDDDAGRFAAIFAALRSELMDLGTWPESVPAPRVFVPQTAGRDVIVMDLDVPPDVAIDVASELRIVGSIDATASRHGADVRYLVNGAAAETLMGHVAVPSAMAGN